MTVGMGVGVAVGVGVDTGVRVGVDVGEVGVGMGSASPQLATKISPEISTITRIEALITKNAILQRALGSFQVEPFVPFKR